MTGCCAVALVTCAFAPTDIRVTVASTPAVQPLLRLESRQRVVGHEQQE